MGVEWKEAGESGWLARESPPNKKRRKKKGNWGNVSQKKEKKGLVRSGKIVWWHKNWVFGVPRGGGLG